MDVEELAKLHVMVRGADAGAASRAIEKLVASGDRSPATFEALTAALIGDLSPDSPAPNAFWRIPHAVWQAAASALARIGPAAYDYLDARIADRGNADRERLRTRAKEVPGFVEYRRVAAEPLDLEAARAAARSPDAFTACRAVERIAASGDQSPETIGLLIELMASELSYEAELSDPWGAVPVYHLWFEAGVAIRALGGAAIDMLIERIAKPVTPDDAKLLERSAHIGRPLFPLARILVTDGDARRARAAEAIVADFVDELPIDEAVQIYLAVCDRERYAARPMPPILRKLWPRFTTGEARAAIAERWEERELRAWIADRLDRDPLAACTLLALLVAAPADATPLMVQLLVPLSDEARWIAIESMLIIDPVRAGEVFASEPELWAWAEKRAGRSASELELRLVIACGRLPEVFEGMVASYELQHDPERLIRVLGSLDVARAREVRDQLRRAAEGRDDARLQAAVARIAAAFPA